MQTGLHHFTLAAHGIDTSVQACFEAYALDRHINANVFFSLRFDFFDYILRQWIKNDGTWH